METLRMPVDTGLVNVEIYDGDTVIGTFKFNPADADIVNRYTEVGNRIKAVEVPKEMQFEDIERINCVLMDATNYLLNGDYANEVYSHCTPLAVATSGDFYFEVILAGVADVVEKVMKKRLDKKNAKIARATAKYTKR